VIPLLVCVLEEPAPVALPVLPKFSFAWSALTPTVTTILPAANAMS
jgi:hypothetical protein